METDRWCNFTFNTSTAAAFIEWSDRISPPAERLRWIMPANDAILGFLALAVTYRNRKEPPIWGSVASAFLDCETGRLALQPGYFWKEQPRLPITYRSARGFRDCLLGPLGSGRREQRPTPFPSPPSPTSSFQTSRALTSNCTRGSAARSGVFELPILSF